MLLPELQTSFHLSLVKPSPGRSTICFLGAWTPTSDGFWRKASWQHVSHTEMLLFLFSLSMLSPLRISHVSPQAPALCGWPPLFLFHKPNGNPLTEVPQLFSQSTNTPVPRSIASSFPPVITEEAFGSLITLLYMVLWLLYPLLSQGPYIIIIILSLLYPPSLPLNWVFLIGIYMSPIFNFTNALLHFTKPPLACFTNRRWLCFLFHLQITSYILIWLCLHHSPNSVDSLCWLLRSTWCCSPYSFLLFASAMPESARFPPGSLVLFLCHLCLWT